MRAKLRLFRLEDALAKPKPKRKVQTASPRAAPAAAIVEAALARVGAPGGQRIICDYPPNGLNPNRNRAWRSRSKAVQNYRRDCQLLTYAVRPKVPDRGDIPVRIDIFPPDEVRRDDDNALASFKAGRDGIATALLVDDARFRVTARMHREPLGCVVFTILEAPDAD